MSTPLQGIKVLDFTGVQSGPSCTQMLAWFGADVIKIERPGVGDVTRHQLRDIPDIDALYFTMLNSNKRSIELNTKTAEGKEVMEKLIREADILVENFHPGAIDHMGFTDKYYGSLSGVLNEINNEITQQSLSISANEIFRMAAIAFILLTVLVWFAKPPFTAKGVG